MMKVTRQDSIDLVQMSVRLRNCLHRKGLHTLGAVMDFAQNEDWLTIRNMGAKTAQEVRELVESLCFVEKKESCLNDADVALTWRIQDILLTDVQLPNRALNALTNAGIDRAYQLLALSEADLMAMGALGTLTVQATVKAIDRFLERCRYDKALEESQRGLVQRAVDLADYLGCRRSWCVHEFLQVHDAYPALQRDTFMYKLYESQDIREYTQHKLQRVFDEAGGIVSESDVYEHVPGYLGNTTIISEILLDMETDGKITIDSEEGLIRRVYPSVLPYVHALEDEKSCDMILRRLKDETLEEIGVSYGVSRERVRQIIGKQFAKWIKQGIRFAEDKYRTVFDQYIISKPDFIMAFDEPIETYNYLEITCEAEKKQRLSLDQALEDQTLSLEIRRRIEKAVYKDYLFADGTRILRKRQELVHHVVRKYCREQVQFDDFRQIYTSFLEEHNLQDHSELLLEAATYRNHLSEADYVLWTRGGLLRYYDISSQDYTELLETLDIGQYLNMEISTLKLFRQAPEIMQEYDIHDANELHNLLKKIWRDDLPPVNFKRMPTLEVGKANRDNQVFDLLLQYAPISLDDLAAKMEEEYGIAANTAKGTCFRCIDEFYFNGMYTIDTPPLPADQAEAMRNHLCEDYYAITEVRSKYLQLFPNENEANINPYTLKMLGFRVYSGYVIRNTYANGDSYFRELLTSADVIDANAFPRSILAVQAYSEVLRDLRQSREIVEFGPRKYIHIRRLNSIGVTKDTLQEYCDAAARFIDRGAYFSVESIRQDGFAHSLDDLGFDEWFYGSVLLEDRERFAYQRIGGTRLLCKGPQTSNLFMDMLHQMLEEKLKMDIYDLHEHLMERYGIRLPFDKLVELIRKSDLYYDTIMEAVYLNYDVYFEEV